MCSEKLACRLSWLIGHVLASKQYISSVFLNKDSVSRLIYLQMRGQNKINIVSQDEQSWFRLTDNLILCTMHRP